MFGVLAVGGEWVGTAEYQTLPDPMKGDDFMQVPLTSVEELKPFVDSLQSVPKTGLHNPWKNPERYVELGHVSNKAGQCLRDPEIANFFARLIQRVCPKSYAQAMGEVQVTAHFLENFSGDQVSLSGVV